MQINTFPITLDETRMLSPNVKHFIFRSEQTPAFHYLPGQFITLHFLHGDKMLKRSYSIANVPTQNNRIEFSASYVEGGPGTELLFNLAHGETLQASGPFGRLVLREDIPQRYILMATSTGITPYRAMLTELKKRLQTHPKLHVVILQGVQKRENILFLDDFLAFAADCPRVTFRAHLSREYPQHPLAHEYAGHIQTSLQDLALNPTEDLVYLCGNPGMIDETFSLLKENGFAIQHIIREKYTSRT